ncbi:MAG: methyltransferase [Oscillospiraceae bacterium]|jgi:16S rRNA (guanine1207-N2)-methyltransferase|nr:methyltransferase [Oscillospiraceae bacterium]
MGHYFTDDDSLKKEINKLTYHFAGVDYSFMTGAGVFSKNRVDPASEILIKTVPALSGSLLDMGCGYGCIGIVLAKTYALRLTLADVNPRAARFAALNSEANGVVSDVVVSNRFDAVTGRFDTIVINPPIHAGKAATYGMYEDSLPRLGEGGRLFVVTLKKHGAESTRDKLADVFGNCATLYRKKGCFVFCCEKTGGTSGRFPGGRD